MPERYSSTDNTSPPRRTNIRTKDRILTDHSTQQLYEIKEIFETGYKPRNPSKISAGSQDKAQVPKNTFKPRGARIQKPRPVKLTNIVEKSDLIDQAMKQSANISIFRCEKLNLPDNSWKHQLDDFKVLETAGTKKKNYPKEMALLDTEKQNLVNRKNLIYNQKMVQDQALDNKNTGGVVGAWNCLRNRDIDLGHGDTMTTRNNLDGTGISKW